MNNGPVWVKRRHAAGCDGAMFRDPGIVHVDRIGRIGNGGIVAHLYRCNRCWAGCPATVLVAEFLMQGKAEMAVWRERRS